MKRKVSVVVDADGSKIGLGGRPQTADKRKLGDPSPPSKIKTKRETKRKTQNPCTWPWSAFHSYRRTIRLPPLLNHSSTRLQILTIPDV